MSTPRALLAVLALVVLIGAGCSSLIGFVDPVAPQPCGDLHPERRCLAMADRALEGTGLTRDDVVAVLIVPDPPPSDGRILETLGGARSITVRVELGDGTTRESRMCGGIPGGPACFDEAPDWVKDVDLLGSGYSDVTCAGEPPDGCPSPIPTIDPVAAAAAVAIRVPRLEIPIDHTGAYEVRLGEGSIPNGVISEAAFHLPDPWPDDATFAEFGTFMRIRSLEPDGRPFDNKYDHGWREGVERIDVFIVFDVRRFEPGAVFRIEDVVVR
jgi:hypothetical protein